MPVHQCVPPPPSADDDCSPRYQMAPAKLDDGLAEQGSERFVLQSGDQCLVGGLREGAGRDFLQGVGVVVGERGGGMVGCS